MFNLLMQVAALYRDQLYKAVIALMIVGTAIALLGMIGLGIMLAVVGMVISGLLALLDGDAVSATISGVVLILIGILANNNL